MNNFNAYCEFNYRCFFLFLQLWISLPKTLPHTNNKRNRRIQIRSEKRKGIESSESLFLPFWFDLWFFFFFICFSAIKKIHSISLFGRCSITKVVVVVVIISFQRRRRQRSVNTSDSCVCVCAALMYRFKNSQFFLLLLLLPSPIQLSSVGRDSEILKFLESITDPE